MKKITAKQEEYCQAISAINGALRLKDKVDRGEALNEIDIEFLCKEMKDANVTMHLTVIYPELQEFCLSMGHLCKEISDEALLNETS